MRRAALLLLACLATWASSQDEPVAGSLFDTVKPDVTIVVKKHPMGADQVEITMLNPKYPPELLREQILYIGKQLGIEPRGLAVGAYPLAGDTNPNLVFVKGSFAVDGIIDVPNKKLQVEPFLKAFTGVPDPFRLRGFSIVFDRLGAEPWVVRRYRDDHVAAEARANRSGMAGIEYRVSVDASKPEDVSFPDRVPEPKAGSAPSESSGGWSPILIGAIAVAAVSAGALVYLALLRTGRPNGNPPGKRG